MIWQVQWKRQMPNFVRHFSQLIICPQTQAQLEAPCKSRYDVITLNQTDYFVYEDAPPNE